MNVLLDKMFNNTQRDYIIHLLKHSSIFYYDIFVETLHKTGISGLKSLLELKHEIFNRDYAQFRYKINKLFVHPRFESQLDSGEIDMLITSAVAQWGTFCKKNIENPELNIRKRNQDFLFFNQEITKAMLEENIITHFKYNAKVYPEQYLYSKYLINEGDYLKSAKVKGVIGHLKYYYYCTFKAFLFRISVISVGRKPYLFYLLKRSEEYTRWLYKHGYNIKYDVPMELYKGDVERPYYLVENGYSVRDEY